MKALVLAAGLGTRLRPLTDRLPKPLFPIGGRPLIWRIIDQLAAAGCDAVAVNTHHLADAIGRSLARYPGKIPIRLRHEPRILGTGGAIRNLADFWDAQPFLVVNADIVFDIDLAAVYRFHAGHTDPATLVVTDFPDLNSVLVTADGRITALRTPAERIPARPELRRRTFTGIQVLDPLVLEFLPPAGFADSIEAFEGMLADGLGLRAFEAPAGRWVDAGTPQRYRRAAAEALLAPAFARAFGRSVAPDQVQWQMLAGDGSDRRWFRLRSPAGTLVLADHGLAKTEGPSEAEAFIAIGRHLHRRAVPVPAIQAQEPFAGQVVMEDLGDLHLQTAALRTADPAARRDLYRRVIAVLVPMARAAARGFNPGWCHQAPRYDRQTIVEAEGGYFLEAYVRSVAGIQVADESIRPAFEHLARRIGRLEPGFMHRDFQSRNIMLCRGQVRIIDFQGGRLGPLAYDLASLLIDPYVDLADDLQAALVTDAIVHLGLAGRAAETFQAGYRYCALARNLQILGAFGFLSRVKGKTGFAGHIAPAMAGLRRRLDQMADEELDPLRNLVNRL